MVLLSSAATAEEKPAASLIIPYFEVSTSASGKTTLFSVSNAGSAPAIAHVTLWTSYWQPTMTFDVVLAAHDIATYNVRDILNGTFPATDPLGLPGCSSYPSPAFGAVQRQTLWQDHQGQSCLASDTGGLAVGIITIDLVRQCTPLQTASYAGGSGSTPLSAGYFASGGGGLALNGNVLLGDFHLVDPQQNYAQGETAFHLPASAASFPSTGDTFYSALGSQGADNRAPLSTVLYARVINGGAFTGGTQLVLLRQPQRVAAYTEIECGQSPWTEEENKLDMMVLDESAQSFLSQRPLEAGTQKIDIKGWAELPQFGAITLRSAEASPMAGLVLHNASGLFGTGFKMQSLGNDAGDGGLDEMANGFRVDFSATVASGDATFDGSCWSGGSATSCTLVAWHFGDGASATTGGIDTSHTYTQNGVYPVTLIARSGAGVKAAATRFVEIEGLGGGGGGPGGGSGELTVAFVALQTPGTLSVGFQGSCFLDGAPVGCQNPRWDFGDGGASTVISPSHLYAQAGTYPVSFTAAVGQQTATATTNVIVEVIDPGPGATFEVHFTAVQIPGTLHVQFVGACFSEGLAVACGNPQWTFGDGGTGNAAAVQHTYAAPGTYPVTFTASHDGETDSATTNLEVVPVTPPEVLFEVVFSATQTPNTLQVQFNGSCRADGVPVTCQNPGWVFGDGGTGSGVSVSHTYAGPGSYTATFTASFGGQTDSHSTTVTVVPVTVPPNNPPTISSLICTPNPVLGGLISLCVLVVADLDEDGLDFQIDVVGGIGICLRLDQGGNCSTSILGHVTGGVGIPIPFIVATNLLTQTTATIRAIVTDEHGSSSLPITTTIEVLLNHPPVVSVFVCVPPVIVGGLSTLCSFNLVDLDPGELGWTVEVIDGSSVCLGDGPGCPQIIDGGTDGLLTTINFLLRTAPSSSSAIRLRATANDGAQASSVDISVIVL